MFLHNSFDVENCKIGYNFIIFVNKSRREWNIIQINHEVGCIYDTLLFLSAWAAEESTDANDVLSAYHEDAKQFIIQNTRFPRYLFPFLHRHGENESFLFNLFFGRDHEYSNCSSEMLQYTLNNKSYVKRAFWEYYLPNADARAVHNIITMENPDKVAETLEQRSTSRNIDTFLFYILADFDKVVGDLYDIVNSVCTQMNELRGRILPDLCEDFLRKDSVYRKLKTITGANVKNESEFTVSVSLMKADVFSYLVNERNFVLLGYDFEKRLDSEYKYADVSLYSFAQAIASNPLKYDIFTALLAQSPLTTAELSIQLNMSRSALDYNIKEMAKSRLITVEPVDKRTNSYSINYEYLQVVSHLLDIFLYKSQ